MKGLWRRMAGPLMAGLAAVMTAGAQPLARVTVEECHTAAESHWPLAAKTGLIERARDYNVENAARGWLPQVTAGAKASVQSDVTRLPDALKTLVPEGVTLPSLSKDQEGLTLDVSQTLYDGGSIAADRAARVATADVANEEVRTSLYALRERVNGLFFGILLYDGQLALNALLQETLGAEAARMESRVANGTAQEADLDAVSVELLNARQTETNCRERRRAYVVMLALLTGLELGETTAFCRPELTTATTTTAAWTGTMTDCRRPELALYDAQRRQAETRRRQLDAALRPRLGLFAQGGYGKPGLNMLEDGFALYGTVGLRMTWNLSALYTRRNDLRLVDNTLEQVETARRAFLLQTEMDASQQSAETRRLRALLENDDAIIALRERIRRASEARMAGGTTTGTDLMRDVNAEQAARLDKAVHEVELLQAVYALRHTTNR